MIKDFTPGTRVRWVLKRYTPNEYLGGRAEIVRYAGEGWYIVKTIPEGREMVTHEDDIVLDAGVGV